MGRRIRPAVEDSRLAAVVDGCILVVGLGRIRTVVEVAHRLRAEEGIHLVAHSHRGHRTGPVGAHHIVLVEARRTLD